MAREIGHPRTPWRRRTHAGLSAGAHTGAPHPRLCKGGVRIGWECFVRAGKVTPSRLARVMHTSPSGYRTRPHTQHTAFRSPLGGQQTETLPTSFEPRREVGEAVGPWGEVRSSINLCLISVASAPFLAPLLLVSFRNLKSVTSRVWRRVKCAWKWPIVDQSLSFSFVFGPLSLVSFRNLNPSRCGGINDAVPFKLRIRGAGACDPCVGSANRAGYAMSAYPTLSPPISFAARYGPLTDASKTVFCPEI